MIRSSVSRAVKAFFSTAISALAFGAPALPANALELPAPQTLSEPRSSSLDHEIAIGGDGTVVALWVERALPPEVQYRVMVAVKPVGEAKFEEPQQLGLMYDTIYGRPAPPRLIVDSSGIATVVWIRHWSGSDSDATAVVWRAREPETGNWSAAQAIPQGSGSFSPATLGLAVALSPDDVISVVWAGVQRDRRTNGIFVSHKARASTEFSEPHKVGGGGSGWSGWFAYPDVVTGAGGMARVVWRELQQVKASIQTSSSSWTSAVTIGELGATFPAEISPTQPKIAYVRGRTVATWQECNASQVCTAAGSWTEPYQEEFGNSRLISDSGSDVRRVSVTGSSDLPGGPVVVTWEDVGRSGVRASVLDDDAAGFSTPIQVSGGSLPSVVSRSGRVVVGWMDSRSGRVEDSMREYFIPGMASFDPTRQSFGLASVISEPFPDGGIVESKRMSEGKPTFALGPSGEVAMIWEYAPLGSNDSVVQAVICAARTCSPQPGLGISSARQIRFGNGSWTKRLRVRTSVGRYRKIPHFRFRVDLKATGNTIVENVGLRVKFGTGKWSGLRRPSGRTGLCPVACLLPSHSGQIEYRVAKPPRRKYSYPFRVRISSGNTPSVGRTVKVTPSGIKPLR